MNILEQASTWASGDAIQGRVMLVFGVLILALGIFIWRGENTLFKGTIIPLGLITILSIGYGGYIAFTRGSHFERVSQTIEANPDTVIEAELVKAERDHRNYTMIKKIWPLLIALFGIMYLFVQSEYLKGLSIGLMGLALYGLIIDSLLHQRLQPYLEALLSSRN